jgi:two-component system chemotaxis sensor kinase CheA
MKIDLSHFLDTFLQECAEHLETIESGLLRLKTSPADSELLNNIFRAAHSMKGGAGAFGLAHVVKLTHALENLLDQMRNGEATATPESVSIMLQATDFLKILTASRNADCPAGMEETIASLEAIAAAANPGQTPTGPSTQAVKSADAAPDIKPEKEYRVIFQPAADLFTTGCNPLLLLRNLGDVATVVSTRQTGTLPALAELDTASCHLAWELIVRTENSVADLKEVFEFVEDQARVEITPIVAAPVASNEPTRPPDVERRQDGAPADRRESSIRVATEKIDKVIDLVGEMVIAQAMTSELVDHFTPESHDRLKECVSTLERCIRELHERTLSVRMLPVGTIFARFDRLVHDLAQKTGKKISLTISGQDTEVDRGVLEMLSDPLTHLIRNSADHGIETPAERAAAGKPETGSIFLSASHLAGNILVEIDDDGGGLNLARIREKAISKGLISATDDLSDDKIRSLIFEPGFSTRNEVSDISGRGVGMDVVKRNVASLNGTINVSSELGQGTSVKILLPLTLAIMDGLIVRVVDHRFVLPLTSIIETIAVREEQVLNVAGKGEAVRVRDQAIPFLRLHQMFRLAKATHGGEPMPEDDEERPQLAVVVERGSLRAALLVDELLGQQQLVVKNLEKNFRRIEGTLGATILGDGSAALILDVAALINSLSRTDITGKELRPISLVA